MTSNSLTHTKVSMSMLDLDNDDLTVDQWAGFIGASWGEAIENLMMAGSRLEKAVNNFKKQGADGSGKNWKHMYGDLLAVLGMTEQTARGLRKASENKTLNKRANYRYLPVGHTLLGELGKLPETEVTRRIKSGEITPELKQKTIRGWSESTHVQHGLTAEPKEIIQSPEDIAHETYLNYTKQKFITEVCNLICDKKRVTVTEMIQALEVLK